MVTFAQNPALKYVNKTKTKQYGLLGCEAMYYTKRGMEYTE
jgi:hypothetical protein